MNTTKRPQRNTLGNTSVHLKENKTRKMPKILYDSEKERDDYEKDYERAPADWRATMEETKGFLDEQ